MNDKEFLMWIYRRLINHGEGSHVDYMRRLRAISEATDPEKKTRIIFTATELLELLKMMDEDRKPTQPTEQK